jgi:hypothetical protein
LQCGLAAEPLPLLHLCLLLQVGEGLLIDARVSMVSFLLALLGPGKFFLLDCLVVVQYVAVVLLTRQME